MTSNAEAQIDRQTARELVHLSHDGKRWVLEFVQAAVAASQGVPGNQLTSLVGLITADDLAMMARAIEDDRE